MWPDLHETADLVTFTEEILNGKLHFCAVFLFAYCYSYSQNLDIQKIFKFYSPVWESIINIKNNSTMNIYFYFFRDLH